MVSDSILSCRSQQLDDVGVVAESRDTSIGYIFGKKKFWPWTSCARCSPRRELTARQAVYKDNAAGMISAFRLAECQCSLYAWSLRLVEYFDPVLVLGWRSNVNVRDSASGVDIASQFRATYTALSDGAGVDSVRLPPGSEWEATLALPRVPLGRWSILSNMLARI